MAGLALIDSVLCGIATVCGMAIPGTQTLSTTMIALQGWTMGFTSSGSLSYLAIIIVAVVIMCMLIAFILSTQAPALNDNIAPRHAKAKNEPVAAQPAT
ncbi:Uncharacterized protein PBTT_03740 [Plasmodiophora brassicae]